MENDTLKYLAALGVTLVTGMLGFFAKWNLSRLNSFDARLRDAVSTEQLNTAVNGLRDETAKNIDSLCRSIDAQTAQMHETTNLHGQQVQDLYKEMLNLQK